MDMHSRFLEGKISLKKNTHSPPDFYVFLFSSKPIRTAEKSFATLNSLKAQRELTRTVLRLVRRANTSVTELKGKQQMVSSHEQVVPQLL
jgi:hypothetical protein